jgi:hypothetical protein
MYNKEEMHKLLPLLSEVFNDSYPTNNPIELTHLKEKMKNLHQLINEIEGPNIEELNRKLWRILGSGTELYILVVADIGTIMTNINTYKGTVFHEMVKIRLKIGR